MTIPVQINDDIVCLLNSKADEYNNKNFIEDDPVQISHLFDRKEDIEISGFLTAVISWGQRKNIIKSAKYLMQLMDYQPFEFVTGFSQADLNFISRFYYRTFNGTDITCFIKALKNIYIQYNGLESVVTNEYIQTGSLKDALIRLREIFFEQEHPDRTRKHFADISKGASGKRLNMFLRWMVRKDNREVDFGLWDHIHPGDLFIPLDVHTGTVARKLGLLARKQNDWKAVEELTKILTLLDPNDPVKYDFALFGLGIYERF